MPATMQTALVTSSYRGDLERCRLLCESIDRHVTGHACHYILVEPQDVALFAALEGPRRHVVDERDLLPPLLRPFPDPIKRGRRIWLSAYGPPLRGWHVQQLRRLAIAANAGEDVFVSLDSDVVFLKPFDVRSLQTADGRVRFFREEAAIAAIPEPSRSEHRRWARVADRLLGADARQDDTDYVSTLIAWRGDTTRDLRRRIETLWNRPWLKRLAGTRALSECMLYGRFVDTVEGRPDRHAPTGEALCAVYWAGEALDEAALRRFVEALEPHQVAAGFQSFTDTDPDLIRQVAALG